MIFCANLKFSCNSLAKKFPNSTPPQPTLPAWGGGWSQAFACLSIYPHPTPSLGWGFHA